jgi:hypothetical protein
VRLVSARVEGPALMSDMAGTTTAVEKIAEDMLTQQRLYPTVTSIPDIIAIGNIRSIARSKTKSLTPAKRLAMICEVLDALDLAEKRLDQEPVTTA